MIDAFLLLGLIIVFGFFAVYIYEKYKISQVLLLMLLGLLIGPVLNIVDTSEGSVMRGVYPFMSTLALIILLFDGGISLNIFNVFKTISKSLIFTTFTFMLSILVGLVLIPIYHLNIIEALIVGATLAGISSAIVISMVEKVKASEKTKVLLTIESVLNDSLVIIAVFILIQAAITPNLSLSSFANKLLGSFAIATLFGALGAFVWHSLLKKIKSYQFDYMLTLAFLFILYSLTEMVQANGGLAVFVFGLVFGNLKNIPSYIISHKYISLEDERIRDIQYEITFFVNYYMKSWLKRKLVYKFVKISCNDILYSFKMRAKKMKLKGGGYEG